MLLPPAKFLELSRMPACLMKESRSEPREVSGIRLIWFHVKGMVIWQQNTYPISSTVVAKGLCQQDRKMKLLKLLLLPLAFGMATGFTKAFWESGQVTPGKWATGMAVTMFGATREIPKVRQLPTGEGTPASPGSGAQGQNLMGPWWLNNRQEIVLAGTAQV